jgi:hypothetical protein
MPKTNSTTKTDRRSCSSCGRRAARSATYCAGCGEALERDNSVAPAPATVEEIPIESLDDQLHKWTEVGPDDDGPQKADDEVEDESVEDPHDTSSRALDDEAIARLHDIDVRLLGRTVVACPNCFHLAAVHTFSCPGCGITLTWKRREDRLGLWRIEAPTVVCPSCLKPNYWDQTEVEHWDSIVEGPADSEFGGAIYTSIPHSRTSSGLRPRSCSRCGQPFEIRILRLLGFGDLAGWLWNWLR